MKMLGLFRSLLVDVSAAYIKEFGKVSVWNSTQDFMGKNKALLGDVLGGFKGASAHDLDDIVEWITSKKGEVFVKSDAKTLGEYVAS